MIFQNCLVRLSRYIYEDCYAALPEYSEGHCHDINGPGISGPGGPFMFDINGPPGPFMLSQMVPLDHLYQNINGPGKT